MRSRSIAALGLLSLWLALPLAAEPAPEEEPPAEPELVDYQLVLLYENEERDPPEPESESANRTMRIERGRRFHTDQLLRSGAALLAGDIVDGGPLKAAAVLDLEDTTQVQEVFSRSPGVQNGGLEARVFVWWAAPGILRAPDNPEDLVPIWLGLLERPPRRGPVLEPDELKRLQEAHVQHIMSMHESGALFIAGPVENGDDLRGLLIFRIADREQIEKLVAEDPLVQAGRLELELLRWQVPRGSLPES